jgi:hypothetical protein
MRNRLLVFLPVFLTASLPAILFAQHAPDTSVQVDADPMQDQLQAALVNATANLREQISQTRLSRDLSIGDFLSRTDRQAELSRIIKEARPVGGPRWVNERTCQLRVQLAGSEISAMLMGIAHEPDSHSPISPHALKSKLNDWDRLVFTAVGSSAGAELVDSAKPVESAGQWSEVSDAARKNAIAQARSDAARQVIANVNPINLNSSTRAADAFKNTVIADAFNSWLSHRPIVRIEFVDGLKVSVTISVAPDSLSAALRSAIAKDADFASATAIDWTQIDQQLEGFPAAVVGVGSAGSEAPATTLPAVLLPTQPPDWVNQQLLAEGMARGGGSRLKIARAAEARGIVQLHEQFLALHVDPSTTLADAARADPAFSQAVDRALLHTHTYRVDYQADGSVRVKVSLDLHDAWDDLHTSP